MLLFRRKGLIGNINAFIVEENYHVIEDHMKAAKLCRNDVALKKALVEKVMK